MRGPKPLDPIVRFMRFVSINSQGCWLWNGATNTKYGVFRVGSLSDGSRQQQYAHRWSYTHHKGPIDNDLFVCHKCDVKLCVNPDHLFLGTNSENIIDAVNKGFTIGSPRPGSLNGRAVLCESDVLSIRETYVKGVISLAKLSKIYGVSKTQISWILNRKSWKHI